MSTRTTAETNRAKAWIKSRTKARNAALMTAIAALLPVLLACAPAAYSARDRRLLSFSGIGNIRDGEGCNQDVRIMFAEADRVRDVSRQDITAASSPVLVGQCGDRS